MDFYTILKPEIEKVVPVFAEQLSDCKKKLAKTENRLLDEKALLSRLEEQKEKLTSLADDTLAGSDNDYEKFKVSLKKVNAQIEVTSEAVKVLESRIIPAQRKAVEQARQKLGSELRTFCLNHKGDCEIEMSKLLDEIVELRDSFLDVCDRLYADYGLVIINNDAFTPEPKHKRLETLSIIDLSARQRAAIAVEAPTKLVEQQTTPETPVTPELQAIEAQTPSPETPVIRQGIAILG